MDRVRCSEWPLVRGMWATGPDLVALRMDGRVLGREVDEDALDVRRREEDEEGPWPVLRGEMDS